LKLHPFMKKSTKSPHGLPGINPTILPTKNLKIEEGFKSQLSFREIRWSQTQNGCFSIFFITVQPHSSNKDFT